MDQQTPAVERQTMDVDIACVGFGPAMGGFLTTLSRALTNPDGTPRLESRVMPGLPLQVLCYERADDAGFGVSGVVTLAKGIRTSFPDLDPTQIPMAAPVAEERVLYLMDPVGASRRSLLFRAGDACIRALKWMLPVEHDAMRLLYVPPFMCKHGGMVMSIGQFNQWVASQLMATGTVQIWPATPVAAPLVDGHRVTGIRLADQGVGKQGEPEATYMPGMDIRAGLTVVGDGPVGPVSRQLDEQLGVPAGCHRHEWAVGVKMVVSLRDDVDLKPGTVFHTFGYPEPGIFGFMYVYPDKVASLGIFVPSWFDCPVRTSYRYLQHWMMHPYLWRYLEGGTLRSWGAKTLQEAGRRGEPFLSGDGFARIGECSGSTNVLKGSGVDEAWTTGMQLAEGVIELAQQGRPFSSENLQQAYEARRRASWVDREARVAAKSRDGFNWGVFAGMIGMGMTGTTGGLLNIPATSKPAHRRRIPSLEAFYHGRIPAADVAALRTECAKTGQPLHDALMNRAGWPAIPLDGKLLVSHQDVLLQGGKVQAAAGYADHVVFLNPELCKTCEHRLCIEICSAQALMPGEQGVPKFDREKCVHCGACVWNCTRPHPTDPERTNVEFRAGAGGLHSAEN